MPSLHLFLYQYLLPYTVFYLALLVSEFGFIFVLVLLVNILLTGVVLLLFLFLQLLLGSHFFNLQTVIP